jgi:proline iminopeptidase
MDTQTTLLSLANGFHLYTRRAGHSEVKLLCLHGGPGGTSEQYEGYQRKLEKAGFNAEVYYYDQLGSFHSDQPDFTKEENKALLTIERSVDEVEEVRQKLGLEEFYLLGHSWGGLLTQEYMRKYPEHLKGAIVYSMVDDIDEYAAYNDHLRDVYLGQEKADYMRRQEAKGEYDDPKYKKYLEAMNDRYVLRKDQVAKEDLRPAGHQNTYIYNYYQGHNEFLITGALKGWKSTDYLAELYTPTLLLVGEDETMSLAAVEKMNRRLPNSRVRVCPEGGHSHALDDPEHHFPAVAQFLEDVENGTFKNEE